MAFDFEHYKKVWWLWHHPEERNSIAGSDRELYEAKFDRCERLKEKFPHIQREIHVHALRRLGGDERLVDLCDYGPFPEVDEAKRVYLQTLRSGEGSGDREDLE